MLMDCCHSGRYQLFIRFPLGTHLSLYFSSFLIPNPNPNPNPCCHSGTVADLPYKFGADDTDYQIEQCFNMETADEMKAREAKERAEEIKDRKARGEFVVDDTKPQKDYHPEPLPYNPEHGFIIRPAVKDPDEDSGIPVANAEEGEEEKEVDNGNNNNEGKRSGKQKKDDSKKKKKDSKKKKTKNKDAPPPPPPQCSVM